MKVSPGSPLNTNYVITRLSKKLPPGEAERGGTGGEGKVKAWGGGGILDMVFSMVASDEVCFSDRHRGVETNSYEIWAF